MREHKSTEYHSSEYLILKKQIMQSVLDYLLLRCHTSADSIYRSEIIGSVNKFSTDFVSKALDDLIKSGKIVEVKKKGYSYYKPSELK